jgi:hypothetical protein
MGLELENGCYVFQLWLFEQAGMALEAGGSRGRLATGGSRPSSAPSQARLRPSQPSAAYPFAASLQLRPSPLGCACQGQAISAPSSKHGTTEMPQLPGSLSARGAGRERSLKMAAQFKAQEQMKAQEQLRRLSQPPGTAHPAAAGPVRPQTANARTSASRLAASAALAPPPAALTPTLTLTALGASARPATASAAGRVRPASCGAASGAGGSAAAATPAAALAFGAPASPPRPNVTGWAAARQSVRPGGGDAAAAPTVAAMLSRGAQKRLQIPCQPYHQA